MPGDSSFNPLTVEGARDVPELSNSALPLELVELVVYGCERALEHLAVVWRCRAAEVRCRTCTGQLERGAAFGGRPLARRQLRLPDRSRDASSC